MHPLRFAVMTTVVVACALPSRSVLAQPWLELEAGPVKASRLDVRIPGDGGTKLSLVDDLHSDVGAYGRVRIGWDIGRHRISALAAPLRLSADGTVDRAIRFDGQTFAAGTALDAHYQFDTYRLSYRYLLVDREKLDIGIGVTALLRDAEVRLDDGVTSAKKTDIGVVPLLRLELRYQPWRAFAIACDAEGLWAPQGRAFDVLTALEFPAWEHLTPYVGYRFIEGGVDNDQVYNFAFLNFVAFGIRGKL